MSNKNVKVRFEISTASPVIEISQYTIAMIFLLAIACLVIALIFIILHNLSHSQFQNWIQPLKSEPQSTPLLFRPSSSSCTSKADSCEIMIAKARVQSGMKRIEPTIPLVQFVGGNLAAENKTIQRSFETQWQTKANLSPCSSLILELPSPDVGFVSPGWGPETDRPDNIQNAIDCNNSHKLFTYSCKRDVFSDKYRQFQMEKRRRKDELAKQMKRRLRRALADPFSNENHLVLVKNGLTSNKKNVNDLTLSSGAGGSKPVFVSKRGETRTFLNSMRVNVDKILF